MKKGIKVIHTVVENSSGALKLINTQTYNPEGSLCSDLRYDDSGLLQEEITYKYHKQYGKCGIKKCITTDERGEFVSSRTFDTLGNIVESIYQDDNSVFSYDYEYDDNEKLIQRVDFVREKGREERSVRGRVIYSYDSKGNKIEDRYYPECDSDEITLVDGPDASSYTYSEDGELESISKSYLQLRLDTRCGICTIYKYDEDNRLTEKLYRGGSIRYNKEDKGYVSEKSYGTDEDGCIQCQRFDNNGDLIKSWDYFDGEPDLPDVIYSYDYDDEGNWTKRTMQVASEKEVRITRRIIVYFPDNYTKLSTSVAIEPMEEKIEPLVWKDEIVTPGQKTDSPFQKVEFKRIEKKDLLKDE